MFWTLLSFAVLASCQTHEILPLWHVVHRVVEGGFANDIKPFVEKSCLVRPDRKNCA